MNRPIRACVLASLVAACLVPAEGTSPNDEEDPSTELLEMAQDRRNPEVAERVAAALDLMRESYFEDDAAGQVREWLAKESEPWVRYYLLLALIEHDEEEDYPIILEALHDPDPTLRAIAIEFAEEEITSDIESALVAAYPDEELWWVRKEIIETLAEGSGVDSLDLLIEALGDPVRDVQAAAVAALAARPDRRSMGALIRVLESETLVGEDSPATALGPIGDPSAARALEKAARSSYPPVRLASARALAGVGSTGSGDLLMDLLEDPDRGIGAAAAAALVALGIGPSAGRVLAFLARRPDESTFESLVWMEGIDTEDVCHRLLATGELEDDDGRRLAEMCATIEDRHLTGERRGLSTCSLEVGWTKYERFNADARLVTTTADGSRALAWENAPATRNGGVRRRIDAETLVRVVGAAWYLGETWLKVEERDERTELWMRESDLRAIDPAEALEGEKTE
ncbi:MAG TPA: HEAT repeat domain-containing protein [Candidatus Polarisedimenticolia bacterium]|jgi:HEAT repeat protein